MALLGNYSALCKGPGRFLGGSGTSVEVAVRSNWGKSGPNRNVALRADSATAQVLYARPTGGYAPIAWTIPQTSGEISARNTAQMSLDVAPLTIAAGRNIEGSVGMTLALADADLQLIVSASGAATMTLSATGAVAGALFGTGSASMTLSLDTATLGALIDAVGTAAMSLTGAATVTAIGHMSGTTEASNELSPAALATAVGNRIVEAGFTADQILRLLAAHAAGAATGLENGNPQFVGLDGSTVRIDGTYSAGTRTIDALDGA